MIEPCGHLYEYGCDADDESVANLDDLIDRYHPIQDTIKCDDVTISGEDLQRFNNAVAEQAVFSWEDSNYSTEHFCRHLSHYLFGRIIWGVKGVHSRLGADELRLEILEIIDKERRRFEKLRAKFDGGATEPTGRKREPIPEEVRIFVWRRDDGRCVKCGSQDNLEYDHIIPWSKGGSNTARNLQLLCEACNRQKSASI
jgi:hypothetical protein